MSNPNVKNVYGSILTAVAGRLIDPVSRVVLVPGSNDIWDSWQDQDWSCDGGMLYLKQIEVFPTASTTAAFPAIDVVQACGPVLIALHLEVGVIRSANVMDSQGNPPSQEDVTSDGLVQTDDWQAVMDALVVDVPDIEYVQRCKLDKWMPKETLGGVTGGAWGFYIAMSPGVNCNGVYGDQTPS